MCGHRRYYYSLDGDPQVGHRLRRPRLHLLELPAHRAMPQFIIEHELAGRAPLRRVDGPLHPDISIGALAAGIALRLLRQRADGPLRSKAITTSGARKRFRSLSNKRPSLVEGAGRSKAIAKYRQELFARALVRQRDLHGLVDSV